jgi:hypothetical protein
MGAFFGCSSRMNGKPSSPVLRGLGASNGARLLDPWDYNLSRGKFRVAKNNRSTLFDTVSIIESNSLAGYFRLTITGPICARTFNV